MLPVKEVIPSASLSWQVAAEDSCRRRFSNASTLRFKEPLRFPGRGGGSVGVAAATAKAPIPVKRSLHEST